MQDNFSIISPAGYVMDIGVISPSNGTGTYGNVSVSKVLPGGFVQARGRGDYPITGSLSGRQGTMLINCTTGTGGASQAVAFIAFSPTLLLGVALDASNRPYGLLVDTSGNVVGQSEAAGPTLAAGVPLTIELAWDSQKAVRLGGYAALQFNGLIANWNPIVLAWVPFVPTTLYVGTSFGGYGFSTFTGTVGKVQVSDTVIFETSEWEVEAQDLGDSAHLYGSSSISMHAGVDWAAVTDISAGSSFAPDAKIVRLVLSNLSAGSSFAPDAKIVRLALSNLLGGANIAPSAGVDWTAAASLSGETNIISNATEDLAALSSLPGSADVTAGTKVSRPVSTNISAGANLTSNGTAIWGALSDLPGESGLTSTAHLNGFTTEWVVVGDAAARTITLPLPPNRAEGALVYNCVVKWGDGTPNSSITAYDDVDRVHTYAADGTYDVEIIGTMEGWSFDDSGVVGDELKITKVLHWGDSDIFDGFKYLSGGFASCTNLTTLANGGITASGTGILTDGFNTTFYGCASLASIPADLFRHNTAISTHGFQGTFYGCTSLTSIPVDLFRYNTLVSTGGGFENTFYGCTSLTSIPTDLFRYNVAVSSDGFNGTFNSCTSLASVPTNLFKYNSVVTSFASVFQGCTKLQLNKNIFYADGEESTRFLGIACDFTDCFDRAAFTGAQGTAPDLWNCDYGEAIILDVAPVADWELGDYITGQTSLATAVIVEKTSSLVYHIKKHVGTFVLGEVIGVIGTPSKLADQGAANPTFAGVPVMTECFHGVGNSLVSLDNYGDIPIGWI